MIKIAVTGVGYWGPNIIRNFYASPDTYVKMCCDLKEERVAFVKKRYPTLRPVSLSHRQFIGRLFEPGSRTRYPWR